ncbi:Methionine S-methyltransferase [Vitis vinifera]|uniref:Methionine S-methyltransferase n=1 Tax=Vitis vinifera TaxID=29760 RepID=A0A438E9J8_VITVI|nr:Methionine S-methyltransferase [Vitis vinifera]
MKQAIKENRQIFEEDRQEHQKGGSSSQPSNARIKRGLTRSFSVREGASIPPKRIDPYAFPSKQKSIKSLFFTEGVKKVGKAISKFFLFNAIPFNVADSGPYYQSMIDTIAEVGPGIKGPTGYQIGNTYLEEEVTRKSIINFMIYCDRNMIYHSSIDTTNIPKTVDYIFSLMDKVVEEVGEKNVIQVVTDNEKSRKVQTIMEPLVKVLKLVDQDKKPTLSIIYEAMNRAKLVIKASIKQWEKYWEVIDRKWECQLHRHLHVADEWIQEGEEPILSSDNLDWLDKGLPTNEESRETVHEDDGATNRRVSRRTSNATQERDVDSHRKGRVPRTISSSSSSDDGDNEGSRRGGGTSGGSRGVGGTGEGTGGDGSIRGGYVSQVDPGMSWAHGGENYYATQDTNHGYRLRIWEQRKHLERLTTFPSCDDYSSGHDYHRSNYHRIDEHLWNLAFFIPEDWAFTSYEGLNRHPDSIFTDKTIAELGCGNGWISIAIVEKW